MKKLILALLILVTPVLSLAEEEVSKGDLTIVIKNFKNDEGQAVVNLFREQDKMFSHGKPQIFKTASSKIVNGEAIVIFKELKYTLYCAVAVHDLNFNGTMDHHWFGPPAEPFGMSGGFKVTLFSGFPKFKDMKFEFLKDQNEQVIIIQ